MLESTFRTQEVIKAIERRWPNALVLKTDPTYNWSIPDLIVLHQSRWAMLETKISKNASHRPNQDYYVNLANDMSFGAFIYPENKEEVFHGLDRLFQS